MFAVGIVLLLVGIGLDRPPIPIEHARAIGFGTALATGNTSENATLNLTDAPSYTPNNLSVPAGTVLHLTLVNVGNYSHGFTIANQTGSVLNRSWSPAALDHYFAVNGTFASANVTVGAGDTDQLNVSVPASAAGNSYEFTSLVPYQFQAGMLGYFNVTGPPTGPGAMLAVATSGSQLLFVPAVLAVNTSSYPVTVDVAVSNMGSNAHTFWLEAQPNNTLNSANFSTYFSAHPPLAAVNVPTSPGVVKWANFSVKAPGIYQYICTIPGHFADGMTGYLYVGVPPPAPTVPPSTAIVSEWILWTGAAVLALTTLLAAAALLVGRFPRAPPPAGGH